MSMQPGANEGPSLLCRIVLEAIQSTFRNLECSQNCPNRLYTLTDHARFCRAEISHYRGKDSSGNLCFVDVSEAGASIPDEMNLQRAMARFHVRAGDGRLLSGAAAFVEVWSRLPYWRWAARAAMAPGVLPVLELGYRIFLPIRPYISRLFKNDVKRQAHTDEAKRE